MKVPAPSEEEPDEGAEPAESDDQACGGRGIERVRGSGLFVISAVAVFKRAKQLSHFAAAAAPITFALNPTRQLFSRLNQFAWPAARQYLVDGDRQDHCRADGKRYARFEASCRWTSYVMGAANS
jgi:hypothetical protein